VPSSGSSRTGPDASILIRLLGYCAMFANARHPDHQRLGDCAVAVASSSSAVVAVIFIGLVCEARRFPARAHES
jgi:hypothetical protein